MKLKYKYRIVKQDRADGLAYWIVERRKRHWFAEWKHERLVGSESMFPQTYHSFEAAEKAMMKEISELKRFEDEHQQRQIVKTTVVKTHD